MKTMNLRLREEVCKLEKIVKNAHERLQSAPKGFLRIAKKPDGVEYYHKSAEGNGGNGRYLKKQEIAVAKGIAQRDYDEQVVKAAKMRIRGINHFLKIYEKTDLGKIYEKNNQYRKALIEAAEISDDEYILRWEAAEYKKKLIGEDIPEIITEKGERVRSKSEKMIADKLYALGIPYRYECLLVLDGNIKLYPDFTILKMPERKEVYLEHLGMMDDGNYVDSAMFKLNTYERNGIYLGVNLFITHETGKCPLNTRALDGLVKELFCMDFGG